MGTDPLSIHRGRCVCGGGDCTAWCNALSLCVSGICKHAGQHSSDDVTWCDSLKQQTGDSVSYGL